MKVLFISNLYPPLVVGGYEQICFDVAQGLKARGHEVAVLTSLFRALRAQEAPDGERGIYRLLKLKTSGGMPGHAQAPWYARNRIELEQHNSRAVSRVIARSNPDVVMFWNGGNMGRALLSAAERHGRVIYYLLDPWLAPVLLASHDRGWPAIRRRIYHKILAAGGVPSDPIRGDHLIFISRALRSQYMQWGAEVSQSEVIYNGLSPNIFSFRPQHILQRAPDEPYRILYSGRIAPQKGVSTLVTALGKLRALPGLESTCLSMLGSIEGEEYGANLQAQINELDLQSAIEFPARRSRHELPEVYSQHDALAFPSEWQEPFALTLLEAMSVGLPVVSSLAGGSAEIVRDGENAIAFSAGDADELAQKLAWVLTHPQEAAAIGRAASEEIGHRYTLDAQVRAIEAYLQGGISPRAGGLAGVKT